jgi:hypothetical protein
MGVAGGVRAVLVVSVAALVAACGATGGSRSGGGRVGESQSGSSSAGPAPIVPAAPPVETVVAPKPPPTPCVTNRRAQWVFVSLRRQHLWMCEKARVVRDAAITSGRSGPDTETPTGQYRIQGLNRNSILTLSNGQTYPVKYWIPFDAPLFGFHDSAWQRFPYGSPRYRTDGSHGCVHMPLAAIKFLYRWAAIGTPVAIRA